MLNCKQVANRASSLIDGELSTWKTFEMRLHLLMCKGCGRFINQMRITRDMTLATLSSEASGASDETDDGRINTIFSQFSNGKQQRD